MEQEMLFIWPYLVMFNMEKVRRNKLRFNRNRVVKFLQKFLVILSRVRLIYFSNVTDLIKYNF